MSQRVIFHIISIVCDRYQTMSLSYYQSVTSRSREFPFPGIVLFLAALAALYLPLVTEQVTSRHFRILDTNSNFWGLRPFRHLIGVMR